MQRYGNATFHEKKGFAEQGIVYIYQHLYMIQEQQCFHATA